MDIDSYVTSTWLQVSSMLISFIVQYKIIKFIIPAILQAMAQVIRVIHEEWKYLKLCQPEIKLSTKIWIISKWGEQRIKKGFLFWSPWFWKKKKKKRKQRKRTNWIYVPRDKQHMVWKCVITVSMIFLCKNIS